MRIREATLDDAAAIARVHIEAWRTTYAGLIPDDYLAGLNCAEREEKWRESLMGGGGATFSFVAENEAAEIVGFASGGPERSGSRDFTGELYAIYILQDWQRRGIGKALTSAVAKRLLEHGHLALLIRVLAENRSRSFYESLGGVLVAEREIEIGGKGFVELSYGWADLERVAGP